jgi:hypothetical protein
MEERTRKAANQERRILGYQYFQNKKHIVFLKNGLQLRSGRQHYAFEDKLRAIYNRPTKK